MNPDNASAIRLGSFFLCINGLASIVSGLALDHALLCMNAMLLVNLFVTAQAVLGVIMFLFPYPKMLWLVAIVAGVLSTGLAGLPYVLIEQMSGGEDQTKHRGLNTALFQTTLNIAQILAALLGGTFLQMLGEHGLSKLMMYSFISPLVMTVLVRIFV